MSLVEILTLCDADPLVEFLQIRPIKVLSFGCAVGEGFACGVGLSKEERKDIDFTCD
jgi:hypothetical protein